jgi:type I restriction enzyme S subunit
MENIKTTSGQKGIAGADIKAAPFPLPSFEEQQEIVSQVHLALSQIEMAQSACESELARSAALRQSILKEAFSGKLVPQDPRDEPADVLLARIRAERAQKKASAASKKQSSRKPAKSRA